MTKNNKYSITIGWLYPDLMNTYGDRGNIIVLQKRAEWRRIDVKVEQIFVHSSISGLQSSDLLFMGGAQDSQQEIVNKDLLNKKGKVIASMINDGVPGLFICGAYQFLGNHYKTADNKILPGLGLFSLFTENPGVKHNRLIGNVVVEPKVQELSQSLVGFENHGGRTYLEYKNQRLGDVIIGNGNNGKDKSEGIMFKNAFGTYLHGPLLPKNPQLADFLLKLAIERKYNEKVHLEPLDDSIEQKARDQVIAKI